MDGRSKAWLDSGGFFTWTPDRDGATTSLSVFHAELGEPDAPVVVLVHGFPTSSIDWFEVAPLLAIDHRVCLLDFPGFGFSDKPRGGPYSIERDAQLLDHYVSRVLGVERGAVVAHDRGDSVALRFMGLCSEGMSAFDPTHLVLSNGNIYLPMSNLTEFQRLVLRAESAPAVLEVLTPETLAAGMGEATYSPPRSLDDPAIAALASTFAHNDGIAVLHDTIQYLVERSEHEEAWLRSLARSEVPTTVVWGLHDTVSPPRVASHVWHSFLATKPGTNELWYLPAANHYLQEDDPSGFVEVVRRALHRASPDTPGALSSEPGSPILVDRSRARLDTAAEVLANG